MTEYQKELVSKMSNVETQLKEAIEDYNKYIKGESPSDKEIIKMLRKLCDLYREKDDLNDLMVEEMTKAAQELSDNLDKLEEQTDKILAKAEKHLKDKLDSIEDEYYF